MSRPRNELKKVAAPTYGSPIPTKFTMEDTNFLTTAANETGMSVSELVRRSVRLLRQQKQSFRSYGFILDLA